MATPAPLISFFSQHTLEQEHIQTRLLNGGVTLLTQHSLSQIRPGSAKLDNFGAVRETILELDAVVLVTMRHPLDRLYLELKPALQEGKLDFLRVIGDAEAPNIIAQAVFSGHQAAREFGEADPGVVPFRVERTTIG
jgi:dimethylamine/trimethylamine dehydrogenase